MLTEIKTGVRFAKEPVASASVQTWETQTRLLAMEPDIGEPVRRHEVVPLNEPVISPDPPDLPVVPTKVPEKEPA